MTTPTPQQLSLRAGDRVQLLLDDGSMRDTEMAHDPQLLGGHTWVAWLSGIRGCVALSRVKPVPSRTKNETQSADTDRASTPPA